MSIPPNTPPPGLWARFASRVRALFNDIMNFFSTLFSPATQAPRAASSSKKTTLAVSTSAAPVTAPRTLHVIPNAEKLNALYIFRNVALPHPIIHRGQRHSTSGEDNNCAIHATFGTSTKNAGRQTSVYSNQNAKKTRLALIKFLTAIYARHITRQQDDALGALITTLLKAYNTPSYTYERGEDNTGNHLLTHISGDTKPYYINSANERFVGLKAIRGLTQGVDLTDTDLLAIAYLSGKTIRIWRYAPGGTTDIQLMQEYIYAPNQDYMAHVMAEDPDIRTIVEEARPLFPSGDVCDIFNHSNIHFEHLLLNTPLEASVGIRQLFVNDPAIQTEILDGYLWQLKTEFQTYIETGAITENTIETLAKELQKALIALWNNFTQTGIPPDERAVQETERRILRANLRFSDTPLLKGSYHPIDWEQPETREKVRLFYKTALHKDTSAAFKKILEGSETDTLELTKALQQALQILWTENSQPNDADIQFAESKVFATFSLCPAGRALFQYETPVGLWGRADANPAYRMQARMTPTTPARTETAIASTKAIQEAASSPTTRPRSKSI